MPFVLRLQLVVPLLLVIPRLKPPSNQPQVTEAEFIRSPTFLPVKKPLSVLLEQVSPLGSTSFVRVLPPWPSLTKYVVRLWAVEMKPLFWPEMRLMAPGVDGPYWSL